MDTSSVAGNPGESNKRAMELYWSRTPPGNPISIVVTPSTILDKSPGEREIMIAARRLRTGRVGGPSKMRDEDMWGWLAEAEREGGDDHNWIRVTELVQEAFLRGDVPETMKGSVMVLNPQGGDNFRGIGLV